jgi:phosphopantothenoylcysteine decarboxylase/phosphopantothenate--cysteine ligase
VKGKKILIGVCGSIAAYKIATLTRLLKKAGADVKIILTPSAKDFITPLTLSTLSKNPVFSEFVKNNKGEWTNHVELGLWADVFLIAPASANTIAKMANGMCDNLLLATYLSARCKVLVAPAMDLDMLQHPSTSTNIEKIKSFGNLIVEPNDGELASGLVGKGRMAEPEELKQVLSDFFKKKDQLKGKQILITAGPTHEALDPVRFIGNHSTGKMGFALASELANRGARVTLVAGPTNLVLQHPLVNQINVGSALEMKAESDKAFKNANAAILAAAVADYRPKTTSKEKIKKKDEDLTIELIKNPDILAGLGTLKKTNQILAGFALETNNEFSNAKDKLKRKNLDFIVLNSLKNKGAGFKHNTNQISILDKQNKTVNFKLKHKDEVAIDIVDYLVSLMMKKK